MTGIRQVRITNGESFIHDFKRLSTIMAYCASSQMFLHVPRTEVWNNAKDKVIKYYLTNLIFRNGRTVMVIL